MTSFARTANSPLGKRDDAASNGAARNRVVIATPSETSKADRRALQTAIQTLGFESDVFHGVGVSASEIETARWVVLVIGNKFRGDELQILRACDEWPQIKLGFVCLCGLEVAKSHLGRRLRQRNIGLITVTSHTDHAAIPLSSAQTMVIEAGNLAAKADAIARALVPPMYAR